jgi:hypothetical protein
MEHRGQVSSTAAVGRRLRRAPIVVGALLAGAITVIGMATPAQAASGSTQRCRAGIDADAVCVGVEVTSDSSTLSAEFLSFSRVNKICNYSATFRIKDNLGATLGRWYESVAACGHGQVTISVPTTIVASEGRTLQACVTHYVEGRRQQLGVCVPFPT